MEVSVHIPVPAALPPGENPQCPLNKSMGGFQNKSGPTAEKRRYGLWKCFSTFV